MNFFKSSANAGLPQADPGSLENPYTVNITRFQLPPDSFPGTCSTDVASVEFPLWHHATRAAVDPNASFVASGCDCPSVGGPAAPQTPRLLRGGDPQTPRVSCVGETPKPPVLAAWGRPPNPPC